MTSWGCPFDCTFCSVTAMFGKKYRFRSAESVVAEIKEKDPEKIFFYDDNMAANKKRLKRLLQMMIDEGVAVPWGAQVRTDVVRDPELMELMRASKCDFVALGLESVNQATLDSFEKSQTVGDIEHAIKVLHEYGIRAHGMFVLGADHDTPDSVRDTVTFAKKNKIDTVMLNILTPLPGTQQFEELDREGRILERDWSFYDAQHVVFRPKQMTPLHLLQETIKANKRFYATWKPIWTWHKWLWTSKSRAAAARGVLGPHARVRLALVLLAHVVDGGEEPRPASSPARLEQGAAGAEGSGRRIRRDRGLHDCGRGRRRRGSRGLSGLTSAAACDGAPGVCRLGREPWTVPSMAPSMAPRSRDDHPRSARPCGGARERPGLDPCVPAARPGNSRGARRAAGSGARHPRPQDVTMATATFAAGCFWGVEQRFAALPGVTSTEVGYTGGTTENPTYKQVCGNSTGHAEAVRLEFDPERISYEELLAAFFGMHDPTQWNRQGPDFGSQYRSAVFFQDEEQEKAARAAIDQLTESGVFKRKIVTQVVPAGAWWRAEEYHQKYFEKHAGFSCHV